MAWTEMGCPPPPGKYEWRLLADEGLKAEFLLGPGTTTDWLAYGEWVGNHDGTRTVALDAQGNIFLGADSGEGTDVLIKLSPDGKRRLWGVRQLEVADGVERLAVLGDTVFVLQKNKHVFALDAANGRKRGGKIFYNALYEKDIAWRWEMPEADKKQIDVTPMDMELVGTQLVFSYHEYDFVRFVSAQDATVVREVKVPRPGGLTAGPNQTLFIASEGRILAVDEGRDQTRSVVEDAELKSPVGLAWEPVSGDLLVTLNGEGSQHRRRYHDGKLGQHARAQGRPAMGRLRSAGFPRPL